MLITGKCSPASLLRISFSVVLLLLSSALFSQLSLNNLDYSKIPQKKIISFVETQKKAGHEFFADFIPKCFGSQDSSRYYKVSTSYLIHGNTEDVWNEYLSIQPAQAYCGRMVGFGFLYSKDEDKILYREDPFVKMEVGQLFFFNVKLLGGIRNLGIADEVTKIDEKQKIIRFCYIENGKTEGTQEIHMISTEEGYTAITHDTWYKSKSRFRDSLLYPFFHKRSVNEFHNIVRARFESKEENPLYQNCNLSN